MYFQYNQNSFFRFELASGLSGDDKTKVRTTLQGLQEKLNSCIRFSGIKQYRGNMYLLKIRFVESSNGDRVFVKNDDTTCWSHLGYQGTLQELNLAGKSRSGKSAKKAFTTEAF